MIKSEKIHPSLGNMRFDQYLNWYECKVPFKGTEIDIFISLDDIASEEIIIEQAIEFYKNIDKWVDDAKNAVSRNLLKEINSAWLPSESRLLTEHDLQELLTLTGVTILARNCFELCYRVGDLLGGHTIMVSGSTTHGIKSADIVG